MPMPFDRTPDPGEDFVGVVHPPYCECARCVEQPPPAAPPAIAARRGFVTVPISVEVAALVLTPAARVALAELPTSSAVAVTQDPHDDADVTAEDADGRRWRVEPDGGTCELEGGIADAA